MHAFGYEQCCRISRSGTRARVFEVQPHRAPALGITTNLISICDNFREVKSSVLEKESIIQAQQVEIQQLKNENKVKIVSAISNGAVRHHGAQLWLVTENSSSEFQAQTLAVVDSMSTWKAQHRSGNRHGDGRLGEWMLYFGRQLLNGISEKLTRDFMFKVVRGWHPGYFNEISADKSAHSVHTLQQVSQHHLRRIVQSAVTATLDAVETRMGHFALIQFMGTLSPKITFELNRRIMGMETAAETKERAIEAPSGDSKAKGTKVLHTMRVLRRHENVAQRVQPRSSSARFVAKHDRFPLV